MIIMIPLDTTTICTSPADIILRARSELELL